MKAVKIWFLSMSSFLNLSYVWTSMKDMEDHYVNHFGTFPVEFRAWDKIRNLYIYQRMDEVKKYCAEVHKRGGNGTVVVDHIIFKERTLSFTQPQYEPRKVDVLSYNIFNKTEDRTYEYYSFYDEDHAFITQGWRPDCIYYLSLIHRGADEFRLERPVCGIPV